MDESYIIANRTDVGRTREVNEDSMVTFDSPNGRVVAVCDGMGGQAAGDVASRLACDIITDILSNNKFNTPHEAITRACMAANQGILHRASQNPDLDGMGATCVMVIIKDGLVYYGWVGDSRIYYINNGEITQISRDQSYVQQLVDAGQISAAEAEHHPMKNEILNALGLPNMTPPELCVTPLKPEAGSAIMLCSDGLSGMVDNQSISTIVSDKELSPQKRVEKLVDQANSNGGQDNITVQLIQFGGSPFGVNKNSDKGNSSNTSGKNNMMVWAGAAIAAIIIIGLVIGFSFFGNKNKEEKQQATTTEQIKDNRTNSSTSSGAASTVNSTSSKTTESTVVNEKTVVRDTKKEGKAKQTTKRGKGVNVDKTFGTKDSKNDKNPTPKAIENVTGGSTGSGSDVNSFNRGGGND